MAIRSAREGAGIRMPAILRNGRMSSSTASMPSSSSSGPSAATCSTSTISGIFSRRPRSSPILSVIVDDGHEPHAPVSTTRTTPPSMSSTSTLPPSAMRYGRISLRTSSTFSIVSGSGPPPGGAEGGEPPSPSKGDTTGSWATHAGTRLRPRGTIAAAGACGARPTACLSCSCDASGSSSAAERGAQASANARHRRPASISQVGVRDSAGEGGRPRGKSSARRRAWRERRSPEAEAAL